MKKLTAVVLGLGLALASVSFAQDMKSTTMKKTSTSKKGTTSKKTSSKSTAKM